ncbi:pyruvate kinase [Vibrio gazogenes]|uniref:Pyruvate kinase n=1 Tax=Vibrio gazogenes DSM 21264 = NBRC 103151 TaxID=1123492 RepID=A0A1M4Y2K5_VIBGA|nr:pyruvate kinase [Vibrio gazogenes]USP12801.1 pyruvate kinase [Vibrio gazogenes]SHE99918.1 pyruvate kinase [Vibrio gazogenes DSM 21264] [Vibrio gazogenes DSM 21264 = NBRC 103151]SJN56373.1 Pyruvate kinase II [Vibrio gazogenes]
MSKKIQRRTKIVTTLGPSTDRDNNLEALIDAGANVVRLNFSHGTADDHRLRARKVREIAARLGHHVAILGDLQGPKIRVSTFTQGKIILNVGDRFTLDADMPPGAGHQDAVGIDYKNLPNDVQRNDILLLDDGRVQLQVIMVEGQKIHTTVTVGGPLSNNKGINRQGGGLSAQALTEKDKQDILLAAELDVEYLAVSFPRNGQDIQYARSLARDAGLEAKIVAKVERAETVSNQANIDDIIMASDVIMVARGDLGVEIGDPALVGVQKKLIYRAKALNRVVITATQMMESMIENPMPTRAEVMDVANAVIDGTDAVMLSGETAAGKYPVETVKAMAEVCIGAESVMEVKTQSYRLESTFVTAEETVAMSTIYAANHMDGIQAIVTMTESGRTALMTSRLNSELPIFALSKNEKALNRCALYRGVIPWYFDSHQESAYEIALEALSVLKEKKQLAFGDIVIITQGDVMGVEGTTNCMRVLPVF